METVASVLRPITHAARLVSALALGAAVLLPAVASAAHKAPRNAVYGAIAVNPKTKAYGYTYDFGNSRDAKREALRQCGEPACEVVANFRNGCAAVAAGKGKPAAATGATRQEAEAKALRRCGGDCAVLAWACTK